MRSIDFVRDAARVQKAIAETDDNSYVALKQLKVYVPARFAQRDLATIEAEITVLGFWAVVVDDKYFMSSMICAMIRTEPSLVNTVKIDDVEYTEFVYEPGDKLVANRDLVKLDNLLYRIYDEFQAKGRVPWYMDYDDMGSIFDSSTYHAGITVGSTPTVMEIIASVIARDPEKPRQYYRQSIKSKEELVSNPPLVIPLRNVNLGATNTIAKIIGPYFDDGMTSAIVNPSERVERTERILRT